MDTFEKRHSDKYEKVKIACGTQLTMVIAAEYAEIPYKTFIRIAKKLGCYRPNRGGKALTKNGAGGKIPLPDILNGKYPQFQSHKLRLRLIEEGVKKSECEICGISEWNDKPAPLQLDHINGDNSDHRLENLRILCANCHAQTDTFSCRKRKI